MHATSASNRQLYICESNRSDWFSLTSALLVICLRHLTLLFAIVVMS